MEQVVLCGAKRTPIGGLLGALSPLSAPQLGGAAIAAALADAGLAAETIEDCYMGLVLPAGVGQAPARQASLAGGLPMSTPATTVSKVCGSGLQAVIHGAQAIAIGQCRAVIAGGMESMSNAPYLSPATRAGARLGHARMLDHMFHDGLEDAYDAGRLMGSFAEDCARRYQLTRAAQDAYAIASLSRVRRATADGVLAAEITPLRVPRRGGAVKVSVDEQPAKARIDRIPELKPAFDPEGTVTAANASSISDGAAALVLCAESMAQEVDAPIRARILGHAGHAQDPGWFTTAPIAASRRLLAQIGWSVADVDLWEVNEAFAVVVLAFLQDLEIDPARVNIHGGACALGHPIGASGARILVTLLHALEHHGLRRGVAAICIGGGEALAMAIERPGG